MQPSNPLIHKVWLDSTVLIALLAALNTSDVMMRVSLIAPLQFQGDYRPYFTIYEPDFDVSAL